MQGDFILFGQGNYNTLGVLYQLADLGINPLILLVGKDKDWKSGNLIGYSRHARRIIKVDTERDGLEWILQHNSEFGDDTIIYPTSDTAERLLDENFDKLMPKFRFPNAGRQGAVAALMDKHLQTDLAKKAGLRVLESQFSNSPDFSFAKVKYPCMVKPLNSTAGTKGDMKVCNDENELRDALKNGKKTTDFVVQQYINNEADLLFLGVACDDDVTIQAVVAKPGVSPIGEYTHAVISTDVAKYLPELPVVKEFIRDLAYVGPFSIEFGLEKGKNYFFEVNLRNDGTSHYPLSAGVNIAEIFITGKANANVPAQEYEMIDEVGDLRRVQGGEISFAKWIKSFRNAGAYRFYRKGERGLIIPLAKMFLARSFSKFSRLLSKK